MSAVDASQILLLGVGNSGRRDEGVGIRAAGAAQGHLPPGVRVLAIDEIGPAVIAELDGASHVVIVDCIDVGRTPGTIVRFDADDLSPCAARSVHRFGVADLLVAVGQTSDALQEAIVLGIQPASMDPGPELSPEVEAAVPRVVARAARIVAGWTRDAPAPGPRRREEPCSGAGEIRVV
jgi:hydrogenase maturation protease